MSGLLSSLLHHYAFPSFAFPMESVHASFGLSSFLLKVHATESVFSSFARMGRGVSSGGGQSSLGYLFGSDEEPKAARVERASVAPAKENTIAPNQAPPRATRNAPVETFSSKPEDGNTYPDVPAGKLGRNPNNYHRADGQNTGNFITERPSTKVHAAPGGGSSLGYLFGGN